MSNVRMTNRELVLVIPVIPCCAGKASMMANDAESFAPKGPRYFPVPNRCDEVVSDDQPEISEDSKSNSM